VIPRPAPTDLVVDTSAVMAILLGERTARVLVERLGGARAPIISAATVAELEIVAGTRLGPAGRDAARAVLDSANVVTVPVDRIIAGAAVEAYRRFGTGNHRAGLNFGDCFAYATARHYDVPLLCIGADFAHTDIEVVDVMA
jgi:ribonuclease VapC